MTENPKFRDKDIPFALATLIQTLIVQLMETGALSLEQGQRVFDAAARRVGRRKDSPDAVRLIEFLSDQMKWDEMHKARAQWRKRK
jgi:hypothetical protein